MGAVKYIRTKDALYELKCVIGDVSLKVIDEKKNDKNRK